jgi:hypothetical protein
MEGKIKILDHPYAVPVSIFVGSLFTSITTTVSIMLYMGSITNRIVRLETQMEDHLHSTTIMLHQDPISTTAGIILTLNPNENETTVH